MSLKIVFTRGYVALVGEEIDAFAAEFKGSRFLMNLAPSTLPYHVTLITKDELQRTTKQEILDATDCFLPEKVIPVGLGKAKEGSEVVYFIVVAWEKGQEIRKRFGLEPKQFHITLAYSAGDIHTVDKGFNSLIFDQPAPKEFRLQLLLSYAKSCTDRSEAFSLLKYLDFKASSDELCDMLAHFSMLLKHYDDLMAYCLKLIERGQFVKGYIRLGDCLYAKKSYTLSALAFVEAWCGEPPPHQILEYIQRKLQACVSKRSNIWCSLIPEDEMSSLRQLQHVLPVRDMRQVRQVFSLVRSWQLPDSIAIESRERFIYRPMNFEMPRFFSWVVHGLLAGMSTPRNAQDIRALEGIGISTIVTLTEETPLAPEWFAETSVKNIFFPVPNYHAPSSTNYVDFFIQLVLCSAHKSREKESVTDGILVHCGGGKGRAGTFLACYLMRFGLEYPGMLCRSCFTKAERNDQLMTHCKASFCPMSCRPQMSAQEAMALLRTIRPGSIETKHQEDFLRDYGTLLWKRFDEAVREDSEVEQDKPLRVSGKLTRGSSFVLCCGFPASGKSWFSQRLEEAGYIRISQDDLGSRSACERAISKAAMEGRKVVVDRCNPTVSDRSSWLDLANYPSDAVCVHFEADAATCIARAQLRFFHPTLSHPGRIQAAIAHFQKEFQTPSTSEKFTAICSVPSFSASVELLKKFGVDVSADEEMEISGSFFKFPRTQHLMNLGAVTRDDLLLAQTDRNVFFNPPSHYTLSLEEKVDGANVGISIDEAYNFLVQNRSHYVNSKYHVQFKALDKWLYERSEDLMKILLRGGSVQPRRFILFGEWLSATHSIAYSRLPDRFMAFDIFDTKENKFLSRLRFDEVLADTSIAKVPRLQFQFPLSEEAVKNLVQIRSQFYDGPLEGIYFRLDKGDFLSHRAKVVRSDFITGNEFWDKGVIRWNNISHE